MTTLRFKRPKLTWRRLLLGSLGAGAVAGSVWLGRLATMPEADAAPPPPAASAAAPVPAPPANPPADPSEYSLRHVAYIYGGTPITREQLGEYLIARFGPDKVLNLVNKCIIEGACQDRGIIVADAEVDVALADDIADLGVNRREFVEKLLREYHKSLYEWREDVLRPKLLMTKMLREKKEIVVVSDLDVGKAFASAYGERVQCQAIMWPLAEQDELKKQYETLAQDPVEFVRTARTKNSKALLAVGGLLEPLTPHSLNDEVVDQLIFSLKEGEVTPVVKVTLGEVAYCAIIKVLKKLPADPTKKIEDVRPALEKEIIDARVRFAIPQEMAGLQRGANPKIVLKPDLPDDDWEHAEGFKRVEAPVIDGLPKSQQPVAYIYDTTPIRRQQLGDYLIYRYGAERLDLMVNKIIIEKECAERGITVSEPEVQAALAEDIKTSEAGSKQKFIEDYLRVNRTTLYGYREDVIRPKLLLAKLARGSVKVEEEDLRQAFEAYHGERAECQIIMWPRTPRDHEIAIKQYDRIRKNPEEFQNAAKMQASARLAAMAGRIEPFARHTSGDEDFESEVFRLRVGAITPVVETREGYVVARLLRKIPATSAPEDPSAAAAERAKWEEGILKKKVQLQIPAEFAKLREAAAPNLILRPMLREDDWLREVKQEISGTEPKAPRAPKH